MRAIQDDNQEAAELAEMELAAALLRAQFGPTSVDPAAGVIGVCCGDLVVVVDHRGGKVYGPPFGGGDDGQIQRVELVRGRVERAMRRVSEAMRPCGLDFAV
jgi:hypothetical protein